MKIQRKHILIGIGLTVVLILAVVGSLFFTGATPRKAEILIPPGATSGQVSDTLTKAYGKEYATKLMALASTTGQNLASHPGRYVLEKGTSRLMAVLRIGRGRQTPVRLTINNLRTRRDITESVASHFHFTPAQFDSVLNDPATMGRYGLTPDNADALLLNNTFEAWWTDNPARVIERIGKAYDAFWTDKRKSEAKSLGLTPPQVIIIASIAEEESAHADERGRIGRLYINRLEKNMRLQADPTVRFAINDFTVRRIGRQMLMADSPYNTYRVAGLPPGPIRTVEPATVDAILQSAPSEDLYMCARPDFSGYHVFTSDYSEHQHNALEYRRALDSRGVTLQ